MLHILPTIQVLKSLAALIPVFKVSFFVQLRVSLNNVKLSSLSKSRVNNGSHVEACCSKAVLRLDVSVFSLLVELQLHRVSEGLLFVTELSLNKEKYYILLMNTRVLKREASVVSRMLKPTLGAVGSIWEGKCRCQCRSSQRYNPHIFFHN
jgi:hypothetical protein